MRLSPSRPFQDLLDRLAPKFIGAFFVSGILLAGVSCGKKGGTPDWDTPGGTKAEATHTESPHEPLGVPSEDEDAGHEPEPIVAASEPGAPAASEGGLRFIAYNVENWLTMDRYVGGKNLKGATKPEEEKAAVVALLTRHRPDVLGLCEIGAATDLAEIQQDLKAAGLDLPHSHYTGGSDPTRRLGLLSRFPITSTAKPAETEYQLAGRTYAINRGILDATLSARGKTYRFLGLHLKSKRESEQGDQQAIRLNEARLLRRHVDSILKADADARVVVYGDLNDTRATPAIKTITGKYNDPTYLTAIPAKDSRQQAWTHHWALHDIYSRIDFIMVTRALRQEVDFPAAKIIDDEGWDKASDHRAVLAIFR